MEESGHQPVQNPHDRYFEQVFKILPLAKQLMQQFLPADVLASLQLDTLELASESFVNEALKEHLTDLVYTCDTVGEEPVRICLLFEHKSYSTGRVIYNQMERYLLGIREEDIRQERPNFTLTIPILFYHGESAWTLEPLRKHYGPVPAALQRYVPHFDFVVINLRSMPDEEIFAFRDTIALRNVLLMFKHARDNEFFRRNFQKVFIFADRNLSEELAFLLFDSTFFYFQVVTTIQKEEIMEMAQTLPPQYEQKVKTAYEQILEEGMKKGVKKGLKRGLKRGIEKGVEKGERQGMEMLIRNVMLSRPTLSDLEIAEMLRVDIKLVAQVRKALVKP